MNAMSFMGTFSLFCHCTYLVMKFTVVLHTLVLMNMKVKHMRATSCDVQTLKDVRMVVLKTTAGYDGMHQQ